MDVSFKTNSDGNLLTTLAGSEDMITERKELREVKDGKMCGGPVGVVEHVLEDSPSATLDAIVAWANRIGKIFEGSENLLGRSSAAIITTAVDMIKLGAEELVTQLYDSEREKALLKEEMRWMSSGQPFPLDKGRFVKEVYAADSTERKETERKELEGKEIERMELVRKETERKEMEWKKTERKETERKEAERKEIEKEKKRKETVRKEMKRKETERKELERKEMERKEMEGKEIERKEMERKETERKEMQRKKTVPAVSEGCDVTTISPFLIGEVFPLPPLLQRVTCNSIARCGGDLVSPVVQSPPPMVNRGSERAKTGGGACGVMSSSEAEWELVGGRRRRKDLFPPLLLSGRESSDVDKEVVSHWTERRFPIRRQSRSEPRPPSSSVVSIVGRTEGFSYAAALKNARQHINLETLGIGTTRVRKSSNGGLLIEVLGEGSRAKAEELVVRLRGVLKDSAAVSCPIRKSELRIVGLDESVSRDEIAEAISRVGGCPLGDVRVGPILTPNNGLGKAWVQLPMTAAAELVDGAQIRLGWTMARVELLKTRPLQCYRCWEYGHTQNACNNLVDRRGACFRCGQVGHVASTCRNKAHCLVCHDARLEASHRLGGLHCVAQVQVQGTLSGHRRPVTATQGRK